MFRHNLKIGYRSLAKQKSYSFINMLGLTLGMASVIIIFLVVRFELSYDNFHKDTNRIYRVVRGSSLSNADTGTPHKLMDVLMDEVPEIDEAAIAFKLNPSETQVEVNNVLTKVPNIAFTTPSFFKLFNYKWISGDKETALNEPGQVAITETLAKEWFNGDALGKTIRLNNTFDLKVTGVMEDFPKNTDLPIQLAVSHATFTSSDNYFKEFSTSTNSYYQTFLKLHPETSSLQIESKLKQTISKYLGKEQSEKYILLLQPIEDIHFNEEIGNSNFSERAVNKSTLLSMAFVGLLILVTAFINFINLATARAVKKSKEVGVKKVLGSSRLQLIFQFLTEAFLITFSSAILSIIITAVFLPTIASYLSIHLDASLLFTPAVIAILFAGWLLVSLLSGIYPAFIISNFRSISNILKSNLENRQGGGLLLRRGLVIFQFSITFLLITCTLVVLNQLHYIRSKPLGFNKQAVVTIDVPEHSSKDIESIRNELLQNPAVKDVSFSLNTPSATINKWWSDYFHRSDPEEARTMEHKAIDENYLDLYNIELLAGKNITANDSIIEVIINESMMEVIGIENPQQAIGETISFWNIKDAPIVGVVKDFHTVSLHRPIHPVMLWQGYNWMIQKASVKIDMSQTQNVLPKIEDSFTNTFQDYYFTYAFLDEELNTFYWQEEKTSRVLTLFSIIAIFIGGLGLYGLVSFMASQKVKEIGIRKILGASFLNIVNIFTSEFSKLIGVAFLLASPLAYYLMQQWMQDFTFKTEIEWWVFLITILSGILIAGFSIGYQSVKAALTKPVENLRNE